MQSMIDKMNRMLGDPADAIKTLLSNIDEFGTTQAMAKMIQAGFLEKRDPYIANLINMFRVSQLKDLKKKAKVHVPKGAFLLGVMDETMTLQEGEVFCQISGKSNKGRSKRTIQGDVVVYRNPCFHPGDIRVVKAVDNPKLHHLTDVLVFSAQGFRDVPSMLSGGDLDGDDYTIFWDEELFPKIRNYEPMDYNAEDPVRVDEVKLIDIQKFYVNYINSDNLGTIANSHLATADRSQKGALDGACLRLAQKHSLAVDFPKTGKPAKVEEDLRVHVYPDFMEKKDKESYESQKVLGKMYRAIDKSDYREYQSHLVDNTVYDVRLRVPDMERYIQEARKLKGEYGRDLLALMNQYGVQTESEIVSGYIVKWLKKSNKKSMHEIHKQTMGSVLSMRKVWRDRFEQGLEDKPGARHAKAAAWYYVAYHPDERIKDFSDEGRFLSFPWVLVDIICEIAIMNNDRVPAEDQAKPVDDALVKRLAASQNSIKISMIYSSDDEDDETDITDDEDENEDDEDEEEQEQKQEVGEKSDDNDEDDDEDDEDNTAIKSFVLSAKPQIQDSPAHTTSPVPQHNNTFTTLGANATEEELANALLN
ncbi:RNA dependent RNA polymerase-domain-containing protein [Zychaea mexicana]|uniref:RNA dependent RNA polymerase-domain-containing protein n=1 Tax=Zychaea mexicana TaxID=64656 RepID=UPI0022FE9222|nr:RNA dependent RNA polymerase-domain-containing protein [Zychaea mexicana]KAI9493548.1 RNA dependent RNA polymerase-domain-containing protein [Zychaea mexicana]